MLPDEGAPPSPDGFFDTYLLDAVGRFCGSQIHKIDAGNEQDKQGNEGKKANVFDSSTGLNSIFVLTVQVVVGKGLDEQLDLCTRVFALDVIRNFGVELLLVSPFFQHHIGIE